MYGTKEPKSMQIFTSKTQRNTFILLALIFLGGLFIRAYKVGSLPGGLYPDESVNGIDALHALETNHFSLFYPNNNGREGLFINLQAVAVHFFGNTITSLRSLAVIFGSLAILGMYFLAKEVWQRRSAGLIAAFLVATSYWAINFSRIGFRASMVPFVLSFMLFFFARGVRRKKYSDFVWAGLFFGLGLNTYTAFRAVPFVLFLLVPTILIAFKKPWKMFAKFIPVFIVAGLITGGAMLYDYAKNPDHFSSRSNNVSVFSVGSGTEVVKTLGLNIIKSVGQYNFKGDKNWRHNYSGQPLLDPVVNLAFAASVVMLVWQTYKILRDRFTKKKYDATIFRNILVLSAVFVMLLPEILTNEGIPHALRAIGTMPGVFLAATWSVLWVYDHFRKANSKNIASTIIILAIVISAAFNLTKYFVYFGNAPQQFSEFNKSYTEMANYILSLPDGVTKYVDANAGGTWIDNNLPVTAEPIFYLTYGKAQNVIFLTPQSTVQIQTENSVIIMQQYDDNLVHNITERYSNAKVEHIDLNPGTESEFTVIEFL